MWTVARYVLGQKIKRRRKYPLVLMLEPLMRCNLSCAGCGKIQYPSHVVKSTLSVEESLNAAKECGTPIVSIAGGEPLLHPNICQIVEGLIHQKRFVYLCTNALLLEENLDLFTPNKRLTFSIHLDGLEDDHDLAVCREGVFEIAHAAIKRAIARGFRVTTNATLFNSANPERVRDYFDGMMDLGVEGMMISPGYSYEKAPEQDNFLQQRSTHHLFRQILRKAKRRWRFNQSPLFLEFLTGRHDFDCTPWGNPTYNVFGWQRPCYLLQEGYAQSFRELLSETEWEKYGHKSGNSRCQDCMVHSGFEATAVDHTFGSFTGFFATIKAVLVGPNIPDEDHKIPSHGTKNEGERSSLFKQGFSISRSAASNEEMCDACTEAFRYRGTITIESEDGTRHEGYVSNADHTSIELWPKDSARRRLPVKSIRSLHFSGKDMAEGRSYRAWMKKRRAKEIQPDKGAIA